MEIDSALAVRLDPQASLLKVDCSIGRGSVEPGFHPVFFVGFLLLGLFLLLIIEEELRAIIPSVTGLLSGVLYIA